MEFKELLELIEKINHSTIEEFELEKGTSFKVSIKKPKTGQPIQEMVQKISEEKKDVHVIPQQVERAKPKQEQEEHHQKIVSPMVGTFYASSDPNSESYVKEGDIIQENTVVGIVEAMKLFNEIEAEVKGKIVKVLVSNGQLVEYGQPLFLVQPL